MLTLAIALLIFTASMAYSQIKRMQRSAERVARTYQVSDAIGTLFSHYFRLESEDFREELLEEGRFEENLKDYMAEGIIVFDSLHGLVRGNASQLKLLDDIQALEDTLYENLVFAGDSINGNAKIVKGHSFPTRKISSTLFQIRNINDLMRAEERRLMQARKNEYSSNKFLAPLTTLLLGFFALFVFLVSFLLIYRNKLRVRESQAFLQNVLDTTDNIVNYYEPLFNSEKNIIDFNIVYANECNRSYLGLDPEKIIGKPISRVFPHLMLNGEFEQLIQCYEENRKLILDREILAQAGKMWFESIITPMADGILVTIRNFTEEEQVKEELVSLNERLKDQNDELLKLNQEFQIQNSIFKDAEIVAGIGSYIWHLDDGSATMSDNLYRILGYEPDSFNVSYQSYRKFIHPDDLEIYDRLGEETVEIGKSTIQNYRVIDRKGKIKHLYIKGEYVEKEGRPVSFGVVQDITSRVAKDEDLRLRNLELERSNAELQSFNQVASHDLQEPLRKIQMFISRIAGNNALSRNDGEDLKKIGNSAIRMRSLIDNLLNYSRIDFKHENFEKIDLNIVLAKVTEDLSVRIDETGATLAVDKLPVINGISFQMEQLFDNLISNALKYSSQNVTPHLVIQSEKVDCEQIPHTFYKTAKYFYKMTFADNGIGFEQDKAEKIFEVFQRLHLKSEYSGTGIGLAICKKIIENHYGFIYTTSEPGKGSVFVIYLPA
ncbi:ATP-binding protein [Pricia antarctica]|uniref:ATP-binding protein n=1 Tax=Pricia antarctica TaxID=641691 RepID=UPI001FE1BD97|nr:ATP-binding protein [Pricia antarctica]